MFDFAGKVALVAGGAGWLGSPICERLAGQGASVAIADIDAGRAARLAEKINSLHERKAQGASQGARTKALFLDAADESSIVGAVAACVAEFGRLDIMINATFAAVGKLVEEITAEEFDRTLHTNLVGGFLLAREAAAAMVDGGSMVFFGSMYGLIAPDPGAYHTPMKPNPVEYGVAKAGLMQMARYLAVYWAPRRIRVNTVIPGAFPNPQVHAQHPEFVQRLAAKAPLGRVGTAEEIAGAVIYLASDEAAYVTGTTLVVDGGWTAW